MRLALINDSRELAGLGMQYLFGDLRALNGSEVDQLAALLKKQKPYVEAYSDFRGDFLLESGTCSLAMMFFSHIAKTLQQNPNLAFLVPREWTFLGIENYAIPALSTKQDFVYELLNYLYTPEVQQYNFEHASSLPVRADADYLFDAPVIGEFARLMHPTSSYKTILFVNTLTDDQVNNIWLGLKGGF
jgi:spermidine/putrescine-binding protein